MKNKLLIMGLCFIPAVAFAGFEMEGDSVRQPQKAEPAPVVVQPAPAVVAAPLPPPAPATPAAASPANPAPVVAQGFQLVAVSYIGTPDSDIAIIDGFGRDVKLVDALRQIAPGGWHAFLKEELVGKFDKARRVNWNGGRRWVEVLDILSNENDLLIEVDWARKYLYVGEKKLAAVVVTTSSSPEAAKKNNIWIAAPGAHLRETLREWSDRAGWSVVWNIKDEQTQEDKDFELGGGIRHVGEFTGAVNALFESLAVSAKVRAQLWSGNNPPLLYVTRDGEIQ